MTSCFGKYRGIVKDINDPKKLGRVVCSVPEVLGGVFTGWAFPILPTGTVGGIGSFVPPPLEAGVWVEFEGGHVDRPIYSGGWAAEPGGQSELPALARGIKDESANAPKGTDTTTMGDGHTVPEPHAPFGAQAGHNAVYKTPAGIVIEIDSTPGKERIHLWHPTGAWFEMHPDGSRVECAKGDRYSIVFGSDTVHAKGDCNIMAEGDVRITASGKVRIDAAGEAQVNAQTVKLADGGPPIARIGDKVAVTYGDSAGQHSIISGSRKVTCG